MYILILAAILIPLAIAIIFFIEVKFFNLLKTIRKSADEIFMHFHVSVLIENTYLASHFNSKLIQHK